MVKVVVYRDNEVIFEEEGKSCLAAVLLSDGESPLMAGGVFAPQQLIRPTAFGAMLLAIKTLPDIKGLLKDVLLAFARPQNSPGNLN